ncbi:MAG: hypothetical protein KDJ37_14360 [Hyphomicrobiaceae bacterium]|nr:hypothetical protein [Hyphomicrobiaceae bacterium]
MTGTTPRTRLDVVFARKAQRAVILRRGPKRHFCLIAWDLETDTFTPGQWMKGVVRLCDLSPSGDYLLYWAAQYHQSAADRNIERRDGATAAECYEPLADRRAAAFAFRKRHPGRRMPRYLRSEGPGVKAAPKPIDGTWTAISRPPFFSALALWPSFGTWTGGGYFRSDCEVVLSEAEDGMVPVENVPMPIRMKLARYGDQTARCDKEIRDIIAGINDAGRGTDDAEDDDARRAEVVSALKASGVRWLDWLAPQPSGDLLYAADGAVFRLEGWAGIPAKAARERSRLLADFNGLSFQQMRAPAEAMRW